MTTSGSSGLARGLRSFWGLWPEIIKELETKGIQAGPESFGSWNDGDAGLVRAIWCLTRHLRPRNVIIHQGFEPTTSSPVTFPTRPN